MDVSGIKGGMGSQPAQRFVPQNAAQAQALPAANAPSDSVGLQSKSGTSNPLSPEKRLSELKPDELSKLGGGSALETLARTQSGLTIGEATPLLRNKPALESIAGLMEQRSDIKVSDFVSRGPKGKVQIDPSYKDPEAMDFLKTRKDVQPSELSAMRANFTKKFKNPRMGKEAAKKGIELMKKRTDMKPGDVGKLMDSMAGAAGMDGKGPQGKPDEGAAQATLDMFDSASKILSKRTDMDPSRVGELANSVSNLGSPKDKGRAAKVAQGFESATKTLEKNPLREPEEMSRMASTIGDNFKGQDEKSAGAKMNAFTTSSKMMGDNNNVNHESINGFLQQAKTKNPKIGDAAGGSQAQKLSGALGDMAAGVNSGTVSPNNLNSYFKTPSAASQGFKPPAPKPGEEPGKKDNKPGAQAQKPGVKDIKQNPATAKAPAAGAATEPKGAPNTVAPATAAPAETTVAAAPVVAQGSRPV